MTDTPTPADVAPKPAAPAEPKRDDEKRAEPIKLPNDHPLVKAYEAEKAENQAKSARLAEFEQAQMSEAEKAEARVKAAEDRAAQLEVANSRKDLAIEHRLSSEDAALLEGMTDVDAMRRVAERLARQAEEEAGPRAPKPHPAQREGDSPAEDKDALARAFFGI